MLHLQLFESGIYGFIFELKNFSEGYARLAAPKQFIASFPSLTEGK
jgi:hypothetical protein